MAPRVLYAEDDLSNQKLIELRLKRLGWEVSSVPDGESALKKLKEQSYDLVLMDLHMPGISGLEVCETILKRYPKLPCVALTSDDSLIQDFTSSVFKLVLIKPLNEESIAQLKELLSADRR